MTFYPADSDRQAGLSEWLEEVYGGGEVDNQRLAVAAQIVEEMRAAVYRDTGFRCSAGIAHNKVSDLWCREPVLGCGSTDCSGDESSCVQRYRFLVFSRDSSKQG